MQPTSELNFHWNISVKDIEARTSTLIKKARSVYDEIAAAKELSVVTVASKLPHFEAEYFTERDVLDFPQHVFPDKKIRDASCESSRLLSDLEVELEMRKDVFDQFVALQQILDSSLSAEMRRYVNRKVQLGRRNGLHLDEATRKKIELLSKEESRLCIDFNRALNEENTLLEFTIEELKGYPPDLLKELKTLPSGKLEISLKYPHYFPASEKVVNPETRRQLEVAFNSRCKDENTPILKRLMSLRKERSELLSYSTHSDFMLELRMAKNADNVANFLNRLGEKMKDLLTKERARLLELKAEECTRLGISNSGRLEPWDIRYYMNMVKEKDYTVDHQALKKYFPLETIKAGILRLYQHLLGLTFEKITTDDVWHSDVSLYRVADAETHEALGYFYLDLHPREGKYEHAAVFTLQPGCLKPVGSGDTQITVRQPAIVAMVANFSAPSSTTGEPAFLLHDEVETFFHEFGHVMHAICAQAETALFSGTHVETDFVECPSQMLEHWVWCEDGLKALLGEDSEPIPRETLDLLLASRIANAGHFYMRQILLATYDQAIHTTEYQKDPLTPFIDLSRKLIGIEPSPGTCMPAGFRHLAGGYDARYYGYLWSEVFSADMYESRFQYAPDGGCLSRTVGREYRDKILRPGGSVDASNMLHDFLGRDPNDQAFFRLIKLDS